MRLFNVVLLKATLRRFHQTSHEWSCGAFYPASRSRFERFYRIFDHRPGPDRIDPAVTLLNTDKEHTRKYSKHTELMLALILFLKQKTINAGTMWIKANFKMFHFVRTQLVRFIPISKNKDRLTAISGEDFC